MAKEIKRSGTKKNLIVKIVFLVILVAALSAAGYYFVRYKQISAKYKEAIMTQDEKNQQTIAEVSRIMDLPKDETPVIFAVKDKAKLGDSTVTKQFFEKAQNGDVILAYEKANLSIIYRPKEKRIVKTDNYSNFLAAANPIKIAILAPNDQQTATEKLILEKVLNVDIVAKQEPKGNPTQSYVADATGQNATAAQELATKLGLAVGQLPSGETKPEGASLVVVITQPAADTVTE